MADIHTVTKNKIMTIHLFKLIYPSGYVRKGLTLMECQDLMNKRKDLVFELDKSVKITPIKP